MSNYNPKFKINDEALAKLDIPKFVESSQNLSRAVQNMNASLQESYDKMSKLNADKQQREIESHEALLQIADNTKGIQELVSLVREGNEINHQTFELIQQLLTIMTAQTPEEGESIIRGVLNTAAQANEDLDTIQTLIGYGKMLFKLVFPDTDI